MENVTKAILTTAQKSLTFIKGGNATFTFVGKQNRYTYKVTKLDDNSNRYFVSLLSGSDNNNDYRYMGMLFDNSDKLILTKGSKVTEGANSFIAFNYVFQRLVKGLLPQGVEIYHEGRCGKCGRKLTTPESIESGFGPVCINY